MEEQKKRRTLYGSRSSNTCAFCAYHGKALTPKQMKQHGCLAKQCSALLRHPHPLWDEREERRRRRKERKQRLEEAYLEMTGGGSNAVHTETASAEGS
jgi:hypothetical protein